MFLSQEIATIESILQETRRRIFIPKQINALAQTAGVILTLIGIYILSLLISSWMTASIISLLDLSQQELTQLPMAMLVLVPGFLTNLLLLFAWVRLAEKRPLQALGLPKTGA
ncbi:hypothetical protein ACVRXQ_08905 [Streptococcus panodentis]|uniref:FtsX-like permease family protein n=1 Tax=Streptococcus panodentis TaxID=1581472 RepID=A0ABS5AUY4_9STRE|nr:hypothetical protein [Streptococcus panodentis]MBP2620375.1 hypothetical protein [Streptococcus panodentis]